MSRASWGVLSCTVPIGGLFLGLLGAICFGVLMLGFSVELRLWDVLCSLWRQAATHMRARSPKVGSTRGTEGCQGQDGGFRAVLRQLWGLFRVFRGVFILESGPEVFPFPTWLQSALSHVLSFLRSQGGNNRRAKGLRVRCAMGMQRLLGQVQGFPAVLGQLRGFLEFFEGYLFRGLHRILVLTALGR